MATLLKSSNLGGRYGSHYTFSLYYDLSQDKTKAISNITYYLYLQTDQYGSGSGSPLTGHINGSQVGSITSISKNSNVLLGTLEVSIQHDDLGNATANYSASINTVWSNIASASFDGSFSLPNIPRASEPTATSGNVEETIVIYTNRKSSSFKHTLKYTFGSLSGTIATGVTDSKSWTLPSSFYAQFPNSSYKEGTITCETYSGSTLIGTKTCKFTAYASEAKCKPSISIVAEDTNEKVTALTGSNQKLIKFASNVKVTATPSAKNSATIKSTELTNGSKGYSGTSTTFNEVESGLFKATTKDSRGFTGTAEETLSIIDYIKLTCNVELHRETQTGSKVLADISGNFFNGSFGEVANSMSLQFRYKEKSSSSGWSVWQTIQVTINDDNTYSARNADLGSVYDYQKYYDFEFVAKDKLMEVTNAPDTLNPGIPIFAMFENFIELWGYPVFYFDDDDGGGLKLRINPDYIGYPVGSLYMTTRPENPSTYLGGTWTEWGKGRVPVGVDTSQTEFNSAEKTGGSKYLQEHTHKKTMTWRDQSNGRLGYTDSAFLSEDKTYGTTNMSSGDVADITTGDSGNLQPYITCYFWKRTK